jgi:hypothetical protein
MNETIRVMSIVEGRHAPGYRDSELHLETETLGRITVRLSPQAFVELHNALASQQACIDDNQFLPLDIEDYPFNTTHRSVRRGQSQIPGEAVAA